MEATEADVLQLTWLGHSTVVLETSGRKLVSDPLLGRHSGVLRRRGARPSEVWRDPDVVLLSHLHHDHAEVRSLRLLGDVPIITGNRNAGWLHRRHLHGVGLDDGWFDVDEEVSVRLVHAIHHARPMPHRPNDVHGHLVRTPSYTVWLAGDTSLYDDMNGLAALARRERIDLAIVPIAGWGPRLSAGHMGPHEAAEACRRTGARWAMPVHWGTLHMPLTARFGHWMDSPAELFAVELARTAPECSLVALAPGEAVVLDGRG